MRRHGRVKQFYRAVFGWKFKDYGPGYTSFHDGRLAGGFTTDARPAAAASPSPIPRAIYWGSGPSRKPENVPSVPGFS
jgi:predicted enzyme related to lactoylglutathione lyase